MWRNIRQDHQPVFISHLPHPTASRVALICRPLAASCHASQSLGHQKACRLLGPIVALSWAQQPPSCQATLGYHQPILPSPLGSLPCNLSASLPQSCSDWALRPSADPCLNLPPSTAPRPASPRIASPAQRARMACHNSASRVAHAGHHTLNATLSMPLQALGTRPRSGPHPSLSRLNTSPRAPSESQQ